MLIIDIADATYRELSEPDDVSIPQIVYWFSYNIGQLNLLLHESIEFLDNEFSSELTIEQANIFKLLYLIKYYNKQISANLGAGAYDFSEVTEGDSTVRKVSRNEIAKNYIQIKNGYASELTELVYRYKNNQIGPEDVKQINVNCYSYPYGFIY